MKKHFDTGSMVVIIITFFLFILALFTKGFTQDLLLESGVFLVSVKLIMMARANSINSKRLEIEIKEIKAILKEK
jgi:Na+-translocating ferredoxin:NAD+ oxidoreductase RnfE subunit